MAKQASSLPVAESRWDAICVGAGITSLAFGAQLAFRHPGERILLIDKHAVPGGYASSFKRPRAGAVFDCSLHKLSGVRDGGNLRRIFADSGLSQELEFVYPQEYFRACLPSMEISLGNDPEQFLETLIRAFPHEEKALRKLLAEVDLYGKNGYYMYQMIDGSYTAQMADLRYAHAKLKHITVADAFAERFRDPYLQAILAAPGVYVGGFPEDLGYLYYLHVLYATLHKGNAYVSGGAQKLSDTLANKIREADGAVLLGTRVTSIITNEDRQAVGVDTTKGRFWSDRVYVNTSPSYAMNSLFEPSDDLAPVKEKLAGLTPTRSLTTVYLTTDDDPEKLGLSGTEFMLFGAGQGTAIAARSRAHRADCDEALCEQAYWRDSVMEVTNYHALDPSAGRVICLNVLDSVGHWPARTSKFYKEKKQRAADILTDRLLAVRPQLRNRVLHVEVASPRTYQRFTNNTDGAGYGAMVGKNSTAFTFHRQFPIKGVHFLSSWVAGAGYEAAFGFAEMKAKQWRRTDGAHGVADPASGDDISIGTVVP
jgi:all-trans-retinol 13,14-reductase